MGVRTVVWIEVCKGLREISLLVLRLDPFLEKPDIRLKPLL